MTRKSTAGPDVNRPEPRGYEVGETYLFMTVTHYFTGRIISIAPAEIVLDEASWIPDTGRLSECLKKGTVNECEPCRGIAIIPRNGTIAFPWLFALPREAK